jgi:hypothetical protein
MRTTLLALSILSAAAGCRSTRDADDGEISQIDAMGNGMRSTNQVGTDMGQASFGNVFAYYSYIQSLSQEEEQGPAGLGGLPIRSGRFVSQARTAWPDCVTSTDSSYSYDQCEYASSSGGSVSFLLDGTLNYTDGSADGDLTFDLSVSSDDVGVEVGFGWTYGFAWTDTTFAGEWTLDYAAGVSIGGLPALGATTFEASGTVDPPLTWDPACASGPVSGVMDWTSTLREGTDPPETEHVTIEIIACGEATITI